MDRNISRGNGNNHCSLSLSARRAWIEIPALPERYRSAHVALRKESVDRNRKVNARGSEKVKVALRKESVDRNFVSAFDVLTISASLSARRAWIEIVALKGC